MLAYPSTFNVYRRQLPFTDSDAIYQLQLVSIKPCDSIVMDTDNDDDDDDDDDDDEG